MNVLYNVLDAWKHGNQMTASQIEGSLELFHREAHVLELTCIEKVCAVFQRISLLWRHRSMEALDPVKLGESVLKNGISPGSYLPFFHLPFFSRNLILITDPALFRSVLAHERNASGPEAFFSGGIPTEVSRKILGENLLTFEKEKHKTMRRLIAPILSRAIKNPSALLKLCSAEVDKWLQSLKQKEKAEEADDSLNVAKLLPPFIVEAVSRSFMGYEGPFSEISQSVNTVLQLVEKTRSGEEENRYQRALEFLEEQGNEAAQKMTAVDELDWNDVVTLAKLMFFAGQDTTSSLIEYLMCILGSEKHCQWQDALFQEWSEREISEADYLKKNDTLLACIVREGTRLHPPSPEQTRIAKQDLLIDGQYVVPKGAEIHLLHYFSQRDFSRWGPDAAEFNPLRYQNQKVEPMYPFSLGATTCIGQRFALLIVRGLLLEFVKCTQWSSLSSVREVKGGVSLKILPDVEIKLKERSS